MTTSNRLAQETSPYLLQHAHNPVDWYAWGSEALARAKAEDRPILLSIGYSACHWCHVMERESFENPAIAAVMNDLFINIKVDREERPDLDQIYMNAVQIMTGSGGWPLTVFLTPDGEPFFGGTYFPPDDRWGRPGFPRVLHAIADAYRTKRGDVSDNARALLQQLNQSPGRPGAELPTAELLRNAVRQLDARFDPREGGFGGAPKFPQAMTIDFLVRQHHRSNDAAVLQMIELTLDRMAYGGIYDQAGGGFHRYSVDAHWLVPHFEKMLYDNALLAHAYTQAWKRLGRPLYRRIAVETIEFVLRELRDPAGGFYSTLDADSEGVEGKFYVWSLDEFRAAAGAHSELLERFFDVTEQGNFEHQNILHIPRDPQTFARIEGIPEDELMRNARSVLDRLMEVRRSRIRPGRDEKILTDWNGLMLRALAEAAAAFDRKDFADAARANAEFILEHLRDGDTLLHGYKDGRARFRAYLDDHANLADGLLSLYELTLDRRWLSECQRIVDRMISLFEDTDGGGFYFTAKDHEPLVARTKDVFDNATPSGNSVAAGVLLRLAALLDVAHYRDIAEGLFRSTMPHLKQYATGFGRLLSAIDFFVGPSQEIAIRGNPEGFLHQLHARYVPRAVVCASDAEDLPLLKGRPAVNGLPSVYICENAVCRLPITDPSAFATALDALGPDPHAVLK